MSQRDPYWDNIRFLAGALVLFMHAADTIVADRDGLRWLHLATWALRVPAFALVAGYFSSAAPLTRRSVRGLAVTLLVPYVAIETLGRLQIGLMTGHGPWSGWWDGSVPPPVWCLWFLMALLYWRLALPFLARLRYPLTVSVAVALAAGCVPAVEANSAVGRAICFLPFFLLGWKLRQGVLARELRAAWSRTAAWAVLAAAFAVSWPARHHVDLEWLKMRYAYDQPWTTAVPVRLVILVGGMAVALSLLRLAPRRPLPLVTYLGTGGMFIYVLQPLALRPVEAARAVDWVDTWAEQGALLALSLALAAALASPPVRRLAWPVVQPRLFERKSGASSLRGTRRRPLHR